MRCLALVPVLVACATPPKPLPIVADPTMTSPPSAVVATAPSLDEATVISRSHAFFDAIDRHDLVGVRGRLGPMFRLFRDARFLDGAAIQKVVEAAVARHAPVRSRVWSDEHAFVDGNTAVFIGRAVETIPADGNRRPRPRTATTRWCGPVAGSRCGSGCAPGSTRSPRPGTRWIRHPPHAVPEVELGTQKTGRYVSVSERAGSS